MKHNTRIIIFLLMAGLVLSWSSTMVGKADDHFTVQDITMVNLHSPIHDSFIVFWNQTVNDESVIYCKQADEDGNKYIKPFTGKGDHCKQPSVSYKIGFGLFIAHTNFCSDLSNVILNGRRIDPDVAEQKIKFDKSDKKGKNLDPGDKTDFKHSILVSDDKMCAHDSDIAADSQGAHVVWVSEEPDSPETSEIYYRYIGTDTSTDIIQISETDEYRDFEPEIVLDNEGEIYIFWTAENTDGDLDIYYVHGNSADGFCDETPVAATSYDENHPSAAAGAGFVYIAFETGYADQRNIFVYSIVPDFILVNYIASENDVAASNTSPSLSVYPVSGIPMLTWKHEADDSVVVMSAEFCAPTEICAVSEVGEWNNSGLATAISYNSDLPVIAWSQSSSDCQSAVKLKTPYGSLNDTEDTDVEED